MDMSNTRKFTECQVNAEDKFRSSDINLNGEILRIHTIASSKEISNIWHLNQSQICTFFQNYNRLPLSKIDPVTLFEEPAARIIKTQTKIYLGQVYNRKKHGKGIVIYKEGRIYEGYFHENQKNGFGCELYANGNLYIGQFSQNKKHGKGSFYWFSLCTPACTKQASLKIQQYHGDWWGGLPDGEGQHQKTNGDFYIGGFKNGLKHGNGIQYYINGDIYKGQFVNGLAQGYGEYLWSDKSNYKGDFKQGYRNGYGVWESSNKKQQYQGHYLLDRKHGYGVYDWGNGTVYKGQYLQDARTGEGQLYENGELTYRGLWENGEKVQVEQETPLKKTESCKKQYERVHTNPNVNQSMLFRVKQSKVKYKSVNRKNSSTATVKKDKDNFQINFKLVDSNSRISTHRGCQACNKRPITSEYSQKFRRNRFLNPQQCTH